MVVVRVETGDLANAECDALVVNLFLGQEKLQGATAAVDAASGGLISRLLASGDFKGKFGEIAVLYPDGLPARRILLLGLGEKTKFTLDHIRRGSARVSRKARDLGATRVATVLHGAGVGRTKPADAAAALTEGAILGLYRFRLYKSGKVKEDEPAGDLDEIVVVESDKAKAAEARKGVTFATAVADSVNLARDVATVSGKEARPVALGKRAVEMAKEVGLTAKVLGKAECAKLGMGAFLGVNQGSVDDPTFVILEHVPKKKSVPTVVVIGKGITFDTGGISIKPAQDMDQMRFDKCGAAAIFGTLRAAALLNLPVHVVGLAPFTDNMPSGSAVKPGDILTAANGKTIEVMNTDAEGRLILADALAYADRYKPDAVIDLATLTGAVSIALGSQAIGMMGTSPKLLARIKAAGEATHERCWELPFFDEYDEQLKSKVADVKNVGGRAAGTITGGKFLAHFAGEWPWAHLDIASTAWNDGKPEFNGDYSPTMATGVGVRLLVAMLRDWKPMSSR